MHLCRPVQYGQGGLCAKGDLAMDAVTGRIHSYESFGTLDGPGVRFVVFLQGCPLRCLYCHNPDTWECGGGKLVGSDEVLRDILRYHSFLKSGGVTLSGGEPLLQPDFCRAILEGCRTHGLHTALDTSGAAPLALTREAIDAADMLLLDIKALDPGDAERLTGANNAMTLQTLDYCEQTDKEVWVRHVLVPGYTLEENKLRALAAFLRPYQCVKRVEPLAYHKMGDYKWRELGLTLPLEDVPVPTAEEITAAEAIFRDAGLPVP